MKLLILSLCVTYALADVSHVAPHAEEQAQIVKQEYEVSPDGQYQWFIETDNEISAGAKGELINANSDSPSQVVQGQASWITPEGEQVSLQYVADENGYQPQGSHIPTPPPIPEAIIRALEYIRSHPPKTDANAE